MAVSDTLKNQVVTRLTDAAGYLMSPDATYYISLHTGMPVAATPAANELTSAPPDAVMSASVSPLSLKDATLFTDIQTTGCGQPNCRYCRRISYRIWELTWNTRTCTGVRRGQVCISICHVPDWNRKYFD